MRMLLVTLCLAPSLLPQTRDISITNANVSFAVEFNATRRVYVATTDFFKADPAGDPAGVLFKTAWAYRLAGDAQEFILTDANGQATFQNLGPIGIATWSDVDARGQIAATATYLAIPTSANSGVVVCTMQITNISTAPITLNLFHLADMDLCGAAYTTNTATPGGNGHQTYAGSCVETCDHFGGCAERWEVGSYTGIPSGNIDLYRRLEDTALYDLRNDTATAGPFDVRGAFQWQDHVLLPGGSDVFTIAFGHNVAACPTAFTHFATGRAGGGGEPTLSSTPAQLGTTMTVTLGNAPVGTLGIFVFGFTRSTTTLGDLNLYVGGAAATAFAPIGTGGTAQQGLPVPNNPSLCGVNLTGQGFVFGDTTSTSTTGLPVTHTTGGCWVLGLY